MTYVALLRAINVGGKGVMKMSAVKECFEQAGFERVTTFIQSGNVIFETDERMASVLTAKIETALSATFGYKSTAIVRSHAQLKTVVTGVPRSWVRGNHLRRYVAFLRAPVTPQQALEQVDARESVDTVNAGKSVLYMTTLISALKKSGFTKLVSKPVYQDMTIRNYSTCLKILALMDRR